MPDGLAILTFLFSAPPEWVALKRTPYTARHVNALYRAVAANMKIPHRFVCITDQPEGIECETLPVWPPITVGGQQSCYRKIRAFDGEFQRSLGEHVMCFDLDAVILGEITHLATGEDCRILRGSSGKHGQVCYYNGSLWMTRAGAREHFWTLFDPKLAAEKRSKLMMPNGRRVKGSDQAWLSCVSPLEKTYGEEHGIFQYYMLRDKARPPAGARIVFFAGERKPWSNTVAKESPVLHEAWKRFDSLPA